MTRAAVRVAEPSWPNRVADLTESERLVLSVFRDWLAGLSCKYGSGLSLAWNELARELGAGRGRVAMSGLIGLVRAMGHLRRPLHHHQPCCACFSNDEANVLCFLSACQRHDWALARRQAEWMVAPEGVGDLLASGTQWGAALSEGGWTLPARKVPAPTLNEKTDDMLSLAVH